MMGIRSSAMQSSPQSSMSSSPLSLLLGAAAGGLLASLLFKGIAGKGIVASGAAGGFGNDFPIITTITRIPFPEGK